VVVATNLVTGSFGSLFTLGLDDLTLVHHATGFDTTTTGTDMATEKVQTAGPELDAEAVAKQKLVQEQEALQLKLEKATAERMEREKLEPAKAPAAKVIDVEAARKSAGVRFYRTVNGGRITDPGTGKQFSSTSIKSEMTGWLEFQIANNKIEEDKE
jgi:hypothetical protein